MAATITITSITPAVSSEGKYTSTVAYTHVDLADLAMRYKVDSGDWVEFVGEASPGTLVIEGLQSDGVAHLYHLDATTDDVGDTDYGTAPANDVSAGIKIYFDADSDSATDGKIVVRITNAELVAMNYFVGVQNTAGVIKAVDVSSADISSVPVTASAYFTVGDIDTSTSGVLLKDNYTFDIRSQFGAATPVTMPVEIYPFAPLLPGVGCTSVLNWASVVNCTDGTIVITESTDYTGYTVDSRSLSIVYPQVTGVSTPATVVATGTTTVTAAITYLNVTYSADLNNLISSTWTDDNAVVFCYTERFERRMEIFVDCDTDLCAIATCIHDEYARLETAACAVGGYDKMTGADKERFYFLNAQMSLFSTAKACNDTEKLDVIIKAIKAKMPASCGCPDDANNAPVAYAANPYLAIFSGSNLGGGARSFIDVDSTVFTFRTLVAGDDMTVAEAGNTIVITNTQPVVFSIMEYDTTSTVTDGDGEVFITVPSVWNGRQIIGMMAKGDTGAGTVTVNVLINDVAATSATCTAVDIVGVEQTFTTPVDLATNDVIKLQTASTSGTLNGLTASLWIA